MSILKNSAGLSLTLPKPAGYTLLDCIDSGSTTQAVDTGVVARDKEFVIDMEFNGSSARELMGIGTSLSEYFGRNGDAWEKVGNSLNAPVRSRVALHFDVGNLVAEKTSCWLDGSATRAQGTASNWQAATASTFKLFSLAGGYGCKMKLYGLIVKDSEGATLNQFYPAKRDSDGAFGIYDIITKAFKPAATGMSGVGEKKISLAY